MQSIAELERALQFVTKQDRVDTLLELSTLYLDSDLQKSLTHIRAAKKLAKKLKLKKEEAEAERINAEILFITGKYRKALELLENSLQLTLDINDQDGLCNTYLSQGRNYWKLSDYDKSVELYFAALEITKDKTDQALEAEILNNISSIYILIKDFDTAEEYLGKVLKIWEKRENEPGMFNVLINLGVISYQKDDLGKANKYVTQALKMAEKIGKDDYVATATNNLGEFLIKEDKYENALDLYHDFIDLLEGNDRAIWVYSALLNNVATCYLRLNDYSEAEDFMTRSITIARDIDSKEMIVKNLEIIIQLALEQEKYKTAYEASNELYEMKRRINDKEVAARIAEVRLGTKPEKKIRDISKESDRKTSTDEVLEKRMFDIIDENTQYQLMIESSEDLFTLHDRKGKYVYCNRPYLFSIKAEDLIGKSPYNFYKFEHGDLLVRQIKKTFSSGKSANLESMLEIDNEEKWFSHYVYPVNDKDGNIISVAMVSRYKIEDTGERQLVPQVDQDTINQLNALKEKQVYWQSFQEDVRKFVTFRVELFDDQPIKQKVVFFSSSLKDILGINVADDFAKWFKNIHSDEKEVLIEKFRLSVEEGKYLNEHVRIFHPEINNYRWINLILDPVMNKNKKVTFFNGIVTDITDQKLKETDIMKDLQDIKLRKELLDISTQPFVLTSDKGEIFDHNKAFTLLSGYEEEEVLTLNWVSDLTSSESVAAEDKALKKLQGSNTAQKYKKAVIGKNGKVIDTEITAHPILDDEGNLNRIFYLVTDISTQLEKIKSLENSRDDLKDLIQKIPEILIEINNKGTITDCISTPLAKKYGFTKQVKGKELNEIYTREISGKILDSVQECLRIKKPVSIEFEHKLEKQIFWLAGEAVPRSENSVLLALQDKTDIKQNEEDLKLTGMRFSRLFERSPQSLFTLDKELNFLDANPVMMELTGYSLEELQKMKLIDFKVTDQVEFPAVEKLLQGEQLSNFEYMIELSSGKQITVAHSSTAIKGKKEDKVTSHNSWIDVSQIKEEEIRLLQEGEIKEKEYKKKLTKLDKHLTNYSAVINEPRDYASFRLEVDLEKDDPVSIIYCSPSLSKLTGTSDLGDFSKWFGIIDKNDKETLDSALKSTLGSGKKLDETVKLEHPDLKQLRWVRIIAEPVKDKDKVKFINGSVFDVTEERSRETELLRDLRSVDTVTRILEEFAQPLAVCSSSGKFIKVNKAFCDLTGFNEKELVNKRSWKKLIASGDDFDPDESILRSNKTVILEKDILAQDGLKRSIIINIHPDLDKKSNIKSLYCFVTDISDQKQAIEQLETSHSDLNSIISSLPQVIFELDHNGKVLEFLNTSSKFDYPLSREDIGKKLHTVFSSAVAEKITAAVQNCLKNGSQKDISYPIVAGKNTRWFEAEIMFKSDNAVYFLTREITEGIDLKSQLKEISGKFTNIYHNSLIPIFTLDPQLNFQDVNPAGEKFLGIKKNELITKNLKELDDEKGLLVSPFNQLLKGKTLENHEQRITTGNGEDIAFLNYSYPIKDSKGEIKLIQSYWIDISTRKQIEDELRSQQVDLEKTVEDKIKKLQSELTQFHSLIKDPGEQAVFQITGKGDVKNNHEVVIASPHLKKLLNVRSLDIFENWFENIHPKDKKTLMKTISDAFDSDNALKEVFRLSTEKTDRQKWLQISMKPVKSTDENVVTYNGSIIDITEFRNREDSLLSDLENIRSATDILQKTSQPYVHSTLEGKLLSVNEAFCDLTGYSRDELLKTGSWQELLIRSKDLTAEDNKIKEAVEKQISIRFNLELIRKDDKKIQVELMISPDPEKNKTDIHIFASDITEEVEKLNILQRSEKGLRSLLNNLPELMLELDHNGKIISVLNLPPNSLIPEDEDLVSRTIYNLYPGTSADKILKEIQNCLKENTNKKLLFDLGSGENLLWFEADLIYKGEDSVLYVTREITDRILWEDKYQKMSKKFIHNVDNSPIPFYTFDKTLKLTYANPAGAELLKVPEKEILRRTLNDFDSGKDSLSNKMKQVLAGEKIISHELEIKDLKNNKIDILNYSYPIIEENGEIRGFNSIWIDISDRKLIEKELKQHKDNLERSVDDSIKKIKADLFQYESFVNKLDNCGIFRAKVTGVKNRKITLVFNNEAIFNVLETGRSENLDDLFEHLTQKDRNDLLNCMIQPENPDTTLDKIYKLELGGDIQKWIRIYLAITDNAEEKTRSVNGIITDSTDQVLKEQELHQNIASISRTEAILYDSSQPFAVLTQDKMIVNYNPAFSNLIGYKASDLADMNWNDLLHSADGLEYEEKILKKIFESGKAIKYEIDLIRKDGSIINVEIKAHTGSTRKETSDQLYFFINNITSIKTLLSNVENTGIKLQKLVGSIPGSVLETDVHGKILRTLSTSLLEKLSFSTDLSGKNISEVFPPRIAEDLAGIIKSKNSSFIEFSYQKEENTHWLKAEAIHIDDESVLLILSDHSKEKAKEEELLNRITDREEIADRQLKELSENLQQFESYIHEARKFSVFRLAFNLDDPSKHEIVLYSPSFKQLMGSEELNSFADILENIHPEDVERIRNSNLKATKNAAVFDEIFRIRSAENKWIKLIFDPVRKKSGSDFANGVAFDISDLKNIELKLRQNESDLKILLSNTPSAFYSYAPDFTMTYMSKDFMHSLGLTDNDMSIKWTDLFSAAVSNQEALKISENAIKTGVAAASFEIELAKKDGSLLSVEVREAPVVQEGSTISIVGSITDLSSREKIASELKFLTNAVTSLDQPVIITDQNLKILFSNKRGADIFAEADLTGRSLLDLVKTEKKADLKKLLKKTLENNNFWEKELDLIRKDNGKLRKLSVVTAFKGWEEDSEFLAVTFKDVFDATDLTNELKTVKVALTNELEAERSKHSSEIETIRNELTNQLESERNKHSEEIESVRNELTGQLEGLKSKHEQEMDTGTSKHEAELERVKSDLNKELEDLKSKHNEELESVRSKLSSELEIATNSQLQEFTSVKTELDTIKSKHTEELESVRNDLSSELDRIKGELEYKAKAESVLLESQQKLKDTIQISRIGTWEWNIDSGAIICSEGLCQLMGLKQTKQDFDIEFIRDLIHPDSETEFSTFVEQAGNGEKEFDLELKILDPEENEKTLSLKARTYLKDDKPAYLLGVFTEVPPPEIVEVKAAPEKFSSEVPIAVQDVDLSQQLQIFTYLLEKDHDFTSKAKNLHMLQEMQERAEIISIIIQQVITAKEKSMLKFQKFLQNLSQMIGAKIGAKKLVSVRINAKTIELPLEKAIPCGLIIHELVMNCIKHAFPEQRKTFFENEIKIDMVLERKKYFLTVSDNGIGLSKDFNFDKHSSIGLKLVKLWIEQQLQGEFDMDLLQKDGLVVSITFSE